MDYIDWIAIGFLLGILELFAPGIYMVWFGFAALLLSGILYFVPMTLTTQLLVFCGLSVVSIVIGFKVYARFLKKEHVSRPRLNDMAAQLEGKSVRIVEPVEDGKTKVKVGDTVWLAHTEDDLKIGDEAVVIGAEKGVILIIRKK